MARILRRLLIAGFALTVWWLLVRVEVARAQISYDNSQDTVFVHSQTSPFWISGQGNSVFRGIRGFLPTTVVRTASSMPPSRLLSPSMMMSYVMT
jgi:hypothetical protein